MHFKTIFVSIFLVSTFIVNAQEIKTKIQESGFDVKPEPQKEEEFDEARFFIFLGGGISYRTGEVLTGIIASDGKNEPTFHQATTDASGFRNGANVYFGVRYYLEDKLWNFFPKNFGFGLRGNMFYNSNNFPESAPSTPNKTPEKNATVTTQIFTLMGEFSYRNYLTESKKSYLYGSIGLGPSFMNQNQKYTANNSPREYNVNDAFFAVRPAIGVNVPLGYLVHLYSELAYSFSEGKISEGSLSMSQAQLAIGFQFRLNPY